MFKKQTIDWKYYQIFMDFINFSDFYYVNVHSEMIFSYFAELDWQNNRTVVHLVHSTQWAKSRLKMQQTFSEIKKISSNTYSRSWISETQSTYLIRILSCSLKKKKSKHAQAWRNGFEVGWDKKWNFLKNVAYLQKFNFEIVNKISGLFGVFQEVIT